MELIQWLRGGRDQRWTVDDWQAWSSRAYEWCMTATRGLLLALSRIDELEGECARLTAELAAVRRSNPPPAPASTPPTPEARALSGFARRQPTEAEREAKRLIVEYAESVWRELSQVDQDAEEILSRSIERIEIEEPVSDTVFEEYE